MVEQCKQTPGFKVQQFPQMSMSRNTPIGTKGPRLALGGNKAKRKAAAAVTPPIDDHHQLSTAAIQLVASRVHMAHAKSL